MTSYLRKSFFYLVMLVFTGLVIEGIGQITYWYYVGTTYEVKNLEGETGIVEAEPVLPPWLAPQILHPYLGAIYPSRDFEINNPTNEQDKRFTVALFGGSVAFNVREWIKSEIDRRLKETGEEVDWHLAVYAVPGYKQPQQLLAQTYATAVGKQFDLIINIDGYNEAFLSLDENQKRGVNPFYPRLWDLRVTNSTTLVADKVTIQQLRDRLLLAADWINSSVLRYSAITGLLYQVFVNDTESRIIQITASWAANQRPNGLEQTGPWQDYPSMAEAAKAVVDAWFRSSVMMSTIAQYAGSEYFHFLQPNQYVDESKVPTEEELRIAYEKEPKRNPYVDLVYPAMLSRSLDLRTNGVQFIDLTRIFQSTGQTVYQDVCCHLNEFGNKILAHQIVESIVNHTRIEILRRDR